jgi:hypothetical protein
MVDGYDPKEVSAVKTMDWMTNMLWFKPRQCGERTDIFFLRGRMKRDLFVYGMIDSDEEFVVRLFSQCSSVRQFTITSKFFYG